MTVPAFSVYLDTSALMRMVECEVKSPTDRNRHAGGHVVELCADEAPPAGLSTLTIVEFHDALATNWRKNDAGYEEYDQAWVEHSQVRVMELLSRQRLILRSVPPAGIRACHCTHDGGDSRPRKRSSYLGRHSLDHGSCLGARTPVHC